MSGMTLAYVVVGMGLITFALRLSLILGVNRIRLPAPLRLSLKYAAPAVLSAIIFTELATPGGELNLSFTNWRLIAGIAGGLIAWRTRNVLLTIAGGMIVLWLLQWIGGTVGG